MYATRKNSLFPLLTHLFLFSGTIFTQNVEKNIIFMLLVVSEVEIVFTIYRDVFVFVEMYFSELLLQPTVMCHVEKDFKSVLQHENDIFFLLISEIEISGWLSTNIWWEFLSIEKKSKLLFSASLQLKLLSIYKISSIINKQHPYMGDEDPFHPLPTCFSSHFCVPLQKTSSKTRKLWKVSLMVVMRDEWGKM